MKKRVMRIIMGLGASILTLFALSTSASACFIASYQPQEPKCLREE
jgi:AgrD protein